MSSPEISAFPPSARMLEAMRSSRSLSLTRSSATSRKMVVPRARVARAASSGISSIRPGISSAVTSVPISGDGPGDEGAHRLVELRPDVFRGDSPAHPFQHPEEAGSSRVETHPGYPQFARLGQQGRADRERCRGRISRDLHFKGSHFTARLESEPAVPLLDQVPEGAEQYVRCGRARRPVGSRSSNPNSSGHPAKRRQLLIWALDTGSWWRSECSVPTANRERQAIMRPGADAGTHLGQRLGHPPHRPCAGSDRR